MKMKFLVAASLASISTAIVLPQAAQAQETTTSIRGVVTSNGAPVAGATVTITHVPSNTVQTVVSGADGTFVANGLRVGGPFSVAVSADGYESTTVTDVVTTLGSSYTLPVELTSAGQEIVVSASQVKGAGVSVSALDTVLNSAAIGQVATVNRDVRDLARRSPLVDVDLSNNRALTFAGKNPRFNLFTIDGVQVNDSYGLNSDSMPTKRGPVPLEAIEQLSVSIAPFDITDGLFQGGHINAVLKSGSNQFHGNLFFTYTDDWLTGHQIRDDKVDLDFTNKDYGGAISGPIIPDRLFFMVAAERVTEGKPFASGPADGGFAAVIPNLTSAQVQTVTDLTNNLYGYDPGPIPTSEPLTSEFITGKIDANITDRQRLSLTWINAYDVTPTDYDVSSSSSSPAASLRSHDYSTAERLHAGIAQLNSEWTDNFSTEIRALYKNYLQPADPLMGRGFGMFTVCTDPTMTTSATSLANTSNPTTCNSGSPRINLGPDQYRHANVVENTIKGGSIQARLTMGNHEFKADFEGYDHWVYNLFVPQSLGVWYFDSIEDYQNQHASSFVYNNAVSLDPNDAAVDFKYQSYVFGLQDRWQVTPDLLVQAGLRYDLWEGDDRPAANPGFESRYGFSNTATYAGKGVFQPRVQANWQPLDRLRVMAGFGKFAAGNPDIYLGNSFGNTGVLTRTISIRETAPGVYSGVPAGCAGLGAIVLNNVNGQVPDAAKTCLQTLSPVDATLNALDPNFKIPSEWRGVASIDYEADLGPLGDGWNLGADFLYTNTIHGLGFEDLRSVPSGLLTPDGRMRYMPYGGTDTSFADILLTNFDKGRSYVGVVRFDKTWRSGFSLGASYTWEDVKDNAPVTSSQATSLYRYAAFADPNLSAYGISNDQIRWQVKYHAGFDHAFFGDYKTSIQLFGQTIAGRPFSYTMAEAKTDGTGRSPSFGTILNTSNYLLYVPTGLNDPNVVYDSATTARQLDQYINTSVLKNYRGQIAPRNIDQSKSRTRLDMHFEQEIPTGVLHSRISLFADVENFLNLINHDWGISEQVAFPQLVSLVKVQCLDGAGAPSTTTTACATYKYSANSATGIATPNQALTSPVQNSLYLVRVGARLKF